MKTLIDDLKYEWVQSYQFPATINLVISYKGLSMVFGVASNNPTRVGTNTTIFSIYHAAIVCCYYFRDCGIFSKYNTAISHRCPKRVQNLLVKELLRFYKDGLIDKWVRRYEGHS